MGCSDNWARDRVDQEEVAHRREETRYKLGTRSENNPDLVRALNGQPPIEIELQKRLDEYVKHFCMLTHAMNTAQLCNLLVHDEAFYKTFVEHQEMDKQAGRSFFKVTRVPLENSTDYTGISVERIQVLTE